MQNIDIKMGYKQIFCNTINYSISYSSLKGKSVREILQDVLEAIIL